MTSGETIVDVVGAILSEFACGRNQKPNILKSQRGRENVLF